MQAGQLDQQLTLQAPSAARDALGGEVRTWSDVATLWGTVDAITGREVHAAQQLHAEVTLRVRLRYRADITAEHRLMMDGAPLAIHAVLPVGRHEMLTLLCSQGLRDD